jgi:hypothetical protein
MKKFLFGWVLVSFLLLASVVAGNFLFSFFKSANAASPSVPVYSSHDMFIGIVSESLRALLTCYLYPQLKNYGVSLAHAVRFGLTVSGLIGSLWLIVGYGSFELKNPDAFFWSDALILLFQGVASGAGLFFVFKMGETGNRNEF